MSPLEEDKSQVQEKNRKRLAIMFIVIAAVVLAACLAYVLFFRKPTPDAQSQDNRQTVSNPLEVTFETLELASVAPEGYEGIRIADPQGGDFPFVTLVSQKLKDAKYSCEGENTGAFGRLGLSGGEGDGPLPNYTKKLGEQTYGFTSTLGKNCYDAELMQAFRGALPKAIVENLKLKKEKT